MKPLLSFTLLFLIGLSAYTQQKYTISGKVTDAKTGEGLPFVNVYFQGSTIGTQTDDKGNFSLENIKGKYNLVASVESYKAESIEITLNQNLESINLSLGKISNNIYQELSPVLPKELDEKFRNPREKVMVESQKSYYIAGEKLDLDLSIINVQSGFDAILSKIIYVDFIDLEKGIVLKSYKLKVEDNNKAKLEFRIPLFFASGNFRLRAYTQWMRNFSESGLSNIDFTVFGQNFKQEMPEYLQSKLENMSVYVEGNTKLVMGLKSRIMIESLDNFGLGTSTSFKIISPNNKEVLAASTDSLGMSLVEFLPTETGEYQIVSEDKTFKMPPVEKAGIIMAADYVSATENLKIHIQHKGINLDSLNIAIVKAGQIMYYSKIPNKLNSYLFKINIPFQPSNVSIFILDKQYNVISEKTQLIDSIGKDYFTNNKLNYLKPQSNILEFNKKFEHQNGLKVSGSVFKTYGNTFNKPIEIKFVLSEDVNDTTVVRPEFFTISTKDRFNIEGLDFYGKKRLAYTCNRCEITLDSFPSILPVIAKYKPINWTLIMTKNELDDLQRRKEAAEKFLQEEMTSSIKMLDEVVVKAKKKPDPMDPFSQSTPYRALPSSTVQAFQDLSSAVTYLIETFCRGALVKKVIANNFVLPMGDFVNDIRTGTVESLEVFKGTDAAIFNCDCAINVKFYSAKSFLKEMKAFTIEGYYKAP